MLGVGVVPEQAKIRRRRGHAGEASHHLRRVGDAGGVAVARYAPHTHHGGVLARPLLHLCQVRAFVCHVHRDQLETEMLGEREVAIVTGARTQELERSAIAPRAVAPGNAEQQRADQGVVHECEARAASCNDVARLDLEDGGEEGAQLGDPLEPAVVAAVDPVAGAIVVAPRLLEQPSGQVQLLGRRQPAGHVEIEALVAKRLVACAQLLL